MKVFGIGMFRTGTTSLLSALKILGYNRTDDGWQILDNVWNPNIEQDYAALLPLIKERASNIDAASDAPWMFLYKQLDEWFPDSKFVLTYRKDAQAVADSEHRWHLMNGVKESEIPSSGQFRQRYTYHLLKVHSYFSDKPNKLLYMCFEEGQGWQELCDFLDKPIPQIPFPHQNRSK